MGVGREGAKGRAQLEARYVPPMAAEREFDVVVFGATGVTGRRVAAYLAEQAA